MVIVMVMAQANALVMVLALGMAFVAAMALAMALALEMTLALALVLALALALGLAMGLAKVKGVVAGYSSHLKGKNMNEEKAVEILESLYKNVTKYYMNWLKENRNVVDEYREEFFNAFENAVAYLVINHYKTLTGDKETIKELINGFYELILKKIEESLN